MDDRHAQAKQPTPDSLRKRAEEALRASRDDIQKMSTEDAQALIYELQVHQIELEIQNEELRDAQLSLAHSRDQYSDLFEFAPVGYLLLDVSGVICRANLTAANLLAMHRGSLLGMKLSQLVAPDSQDKLHLHRQRLIASGERASCEVSLRRGGGEFDALLDWDIAKTSADESFGDCDGAFRVVVADITPRKIAERQLHDWVDSNRRSSAEALRISEERLSLAFQATRDAIWDCDLVSGTVWWSEAYDQLLGERPPQTSQSWQWWNNRIHPADRQRVSESLATATGSGPEYGDQWQASYRFRHADGRYLFIEDRGVIARDAGGKAVRILGAMRDVSNRVLVERKHLQSERLAAVGQAMTGLVHESRNALNRAQSALRMIGRRAAELPEVPALIDQASDAHNDVQRLFEEVRQYASPLIVHPAPCDLKPLIDKVWQQVMSVNPSRDATLRVHGDDTVPGCHACDATLSRVFRNVFENSLAAASDPVLVDVTCSLCRHGGNPAIRISICDNGAGIDDSIRNTVFEAFFTTKTHGTGLGMAIAKRIVEAHDGVMTVADKNGPGAEFIIVIPQKTRGGKDE